ncbi:unnamed protein product [Owenia fusiformis]|uniref:Uncharacterized protein n=1 Tax=Owenia fusiformis TaxID=6347 RepID=A0A8J1UKP4_OWEFU|nr:unnamed protein product [Owenia fusiformis]
MSKSDVESAIYTNPVFDGDDVYVKPNYNTKTTDQHHYETLQSCPNTGPPPSYNNPLVHPSLPKITPYGDAPPSYPSKSRCALYRLNRTRTLFAIGVGLAVTMAITALFISIGKSHLNDSDEQDGHHMSTRFHTTTGEPNKPGTSDFGGPTKSTQVPGIGVKSSTTVHSRPDSIITTKTTKRPSTINTTKPTQTLTRTSEKVQPSATASRGTDVTNSVDKTTLGPAGLVTYATWGSWEPWNECTVTCGEGVQTRQRMCTKQRDTDIDCDGFFTISRECSPGKCPDCNILCVDGVRNEDCTACECTRSQTTVGAYSSRMVPLDGATVARAETAYSVMAVTGDDGTTTVERLCNSDTIVLKKAGYVDTIAKASNASMVILAVLEPIEMYKQPFDKVALVGGTINFTCEATGKPSPEYFEWFKNGNLLDESIYGKSNILLLESVKLDDNGMYKCRANNDYSSMMSDSAQLIVKESLDDFCDSNPGDELKELPQDCPQNGDVMYPIGKCQGNPCLSSNMVDAAEYCCGPTRQELRQLFCNGYTLIVVVTLECGCIPCNQVNRLDGNEPTAITYLPVEGVFKGRAYDSRDINRPLIYGDVFLNGEKVSFTGLDGEFEFKIPRHMTRIVVMIRENLISDDFIETSKAFDLPRDFSGTFLKDFPIKRKSNIVEIDSKQPQSMSLARDLSSGEPVAELLIPGDSFYTNDGEKYEGKVKASMDFIDPRDPISIDEMPGDLTSVNENGEVEQLDTQGQFHMSFNDANGKPLGLKGKVEVAIEAEFIGETNASYTDVSLWTYNTDTGRWVIEGPLRPVSPTLSHLSRRKRQRYNFFIGDIVIRDRYWVNFDRKVLDYCYANVRAYVDSSNQSPLSTSKFEPTVISQNAFTGGIRRYTTGRNAYNGGPGKERSEGNCIMTVCQNGQFHGYIRATDAEGSLQTSTSLGGSAPNVAGVEVTIEKFGQGGKGKEDYDAVAKVKATNAPEYGPIFYSTSTSGCLPQNSDTCKNCKQNPKNAVCRLCNPSGCMYPVAVAFRDCMESSSSSPHFKFYKAKSHSYSYEVCLKPSNCPDNTALSLVWFPNIDFKVVYLKVKVTRSSSGESKVRAVSKGGQNLEVIGKTYGIKEETTYQQIACVEIKTSGPILVSTGTGTDRTQVDIYVQGDCRLNSAKQLLLDNRKQNPESIFSFLHPLESEPTGPKYGLYDHQSKSDQDAMNEARRRCECGSMSPQKQSCKDETEYGSGIGLEFVCG